jgi:hypothetical protein
MPNHTVLKSLLIGIGFLIGAVAGLVTGILTKIGGASVPAAFLAGGGAFIATTGLCIKVIDSLMP